MKIEVKSISKGNGVRLSTIEGWTTAALPKVLVVVNRDRLKMTPLPREGGRQTKARDIEVVITGYDIYHFEVSHRSYFVSWPNRPTLQQVTKTNWKENPDFLKQIREIAKMANNASTAPIKLQAEKNGTLCRIHYVCDDHRLLPPAPLKIRKLLEPTLNAIVGARLRLWKDHSLDGGPVGYADEAMLHWEDRNKKKKTGRLEVELANGEVLDFPDFNQGRQDYWSGFAIEHLLADLNKQLNRTQGGTIGADLTIDDLLVQENRISLSTVELKALAKREGKHSLLRHLQSMLKVPQKATDISRGSTVTYTGLLSVANALSKRYATPLQNISTKADCIRAMLALTGAPTDDDDFSRGGTVTAYALLKIWLAVTSDH